MIKIIEANTKSLRKKYIQFQNDMYKDVPQYVPTMMSDEMANLDPGKNPAYDYCKIRLWLAERDGVLVGRIGAIISSKANDIWHRKRIRFTRTDYIDDNEVVDALFKTVEDWAREEGMTEIVGPLGTCDFDKEGMLIEGFDEPGMFITYYNHPYYKTQMERLGFEKDVDWLEHRVYVDNTDDEKMQRIGNRVLERGGFRAMHFKSKAELRPHLTEIFTLLNAEYERLYGVVPVSPRQMKYYGDQFVTLINLNYVEVVYDKNDKLVALGVLAPSLSEPMKKSGGRLFPFGFIEVLKTIRDPKVLDMYFIAVSGEYRNAGLAAVVMNNIAARAKKNGVKYAETGPQLEENYNIQKLFVAYHCDREIRRRRCWKKPISDK